MLKGNKNFFHEQNYLFYWNGHGQKIYVNQNFNKRWVVHNLQQNVQKVGNPQPFEKSYIWSKGVVHTWLPKKKIENNYNDNKNRHRPNGSLFKPSRARKLQEHELSQGHKKENKSQEMQT